MDEKCTWVQEGQTRTEKGIIVFGRAFKLLEKAHVELRSLEGHMGAYGGVEKGTLVVEEGTCEKDTLGWMRNAYGVKRGLKKASLYLEGH